jgi:tRNA-2-methylthio-N6-dimethylallyladenosine synthase
MKEVGYDFAFMFMYSDRPDTLAARKLVDDVPNEVKNRRLQEIIALQQESSLKSNKRDLGKVFTVLTEGRSKRSATRMSGRTDTNKVVVFESKDTKTGEYVDVRITDCTAATLIGEIV